MHIHVLVPCTSTAPDKSCMSKPLNGTFIYTLLHALQQSPSVLNIFCFFLKVHACVYNTVIKGNTLNDWQKRATTFAAIACAGM